MRFIEDLGTEYRQYGDASGSDFGMLDYSIPLTLKNQDMVLMLSKLLEYSVYRNEYKAQLGRRRNEMIIGFKNGDLLLKHVVFVRLSKV